MEADTMVTKSRKRINLETGEVSGGLRPLLYVSGPIYSEGMVPLNVRAAVLAAEEAYEKGWAPHIPHLDVLVPLITGNIARARYMDVDLALLHKCDAMLVLPYTIEYTNQEQTGTSEELDFAEDNGIPVYTLETLPGVN